nr:immunoglobulin heavy chain junction region [Mus musculus]
CAREGHYAMDYW